MMREMIRDELYGFLENPASMVDWNQGAFAVLVDVVAETGKRVEDLTLYDLQLISLEVDRRYNGLLKESGK